MAVQRRVGAHDSTHIDRRRYAEQTAPLFEMCKVHIAFALLLVRTACTAHRAIGTATSLAFLAFAFAVISGKGVFPYVLVKA